MSQAHQIETARAAVRAPGEVAGRGGALDALRFVAALLIVVYHFGANAPLPLDSLHPVFSRGYLATDFFLILSGYVLGRAYGRQVLGGRLGAGAFLAKRIQRLWPAQVVVLTLLLAIVILAGVVGLHSKNLEHYTAQAFLMQLFFVQAWGIPGGGGWNHQSWSLSALVVCYALFPMIWGWLARLRSPAALLSLGFIGLMVGDLLVMAVSGRPLYDIGFEYGVVRALPMFLLGLCIARVVEDGKTPVLLAQGLGWLSAGALVLLQVAGRFDLVSLAAIAAIILACGVVPVARPSKMIEEGAKLSFSLFITHAITGLVWFGVTDILTAQLDLPVAVQWVLWGLSVPAALLFAGLFHVLVDGPLQAWIARRLKARRPAASQLPA